MTGRRALIIANDVYEHQGLGRLRAPSADARALSEVLGDEQIGDFTVEVIRNEPAHVISERIEDLFTAARSADVLLLHVSCHGLKSESGELFFAAANTRPDRLGSTAVSADFVQRCMRTSRARSVVLLLDCCYGGAFARGVTVRAGGDVDVLGSFPRERLPSGRGRAVITASSAMEYAFEGNELADDAHHAQPSVFTAALVEGLATGEADRNQDGWVSLDELYDYVFDKVRERSPHQTPSRDVEMQGDLYIARRGRPVTTASPLPAELAQAVVSPLAGIRAGAVQELERVLGGAHAGLALAARHALEDLTRDDSRAVSAAAAAALAGSAVPEPAAEPAAGPAATAAPPAEPAAAESEPEAEPTPAPAPRKPAGRPVSAKPSLPAAADSGTKTSRGTPPVPEPAVAPPGRGLIPPEPAPAREAASAGPAEPVSAAARPPAASRPSGLLITAGLLTLVLSVLTVVALFPTFASGYRLLSYSVNIEQTLINAAVGVAAAVALLVPATSRRIGTGLALGSAATLPADVNTIIYSLHISPPAHLGAELIIVALILVFVSVCLIVVHLARTRDVRIEPRSLAAGPAVAWLVVLLGVAGGVAYLTQLTGRHDYAGFGSVYVNNELVISLIWIALMAVAIPFLAVVARPRSFGVALAAGWVGAGLAEMVFLTGLKTSVLGYTLIAIALLLIPLARTAPPAARPPASEPSAGQPTAAS
jgi:Caspase domain